MTILDAVFLVALGVLAAIAWILETTTRGTNETEPRHAPPSGPAIR